jgi:hypothetical protein
VVKSVRVDDILELSLVPSISMCSMIILCVLVLYTQVNMMFVMLLWVCIHTGQAEKLAWPRWESNSANCPFLFWNLQAGALNEWSHIYYFAVEKWYSIAC